MNQQVKTCVTVKRKYSKIKFTMNKAIITLIVDDEISSVELLEGLIGQVKEINLIKSFTNPEAALDFIFSQPFQINLIFLDISMPVITGFDFVKALKNMPLLPSIVFVTGFEEYAIEAIRASAFDFLVKPATLNDLNAVLDRYNEKRFEDQKKANFDLLLQRLNPGKKLVFPHNCGFVTYHQDDIFYITADGNYSHIHLIAGKQQMVTMQIGQIEKMLSEHDFFRINRSALINLKYLESANHKTKNCQIGINGFNQDFTTSGKKIRELQNFLIQYQQ